MMTLDETLAALDAVALTPDDVTVQRARHALDGVGRWTGWAIESAVRDAALAVAVWDRAHAREATEARETAKAPAAPATDALRPRHA